jgi:hypothetical protein
VALQHRLGVLPERRIGSDPADPAGAYRGKENIERDPWLAGVHRDYGSYSEAMSISPAIEDVFVSVQIQVLTHGLKTATVGDKTFPVRVTPKEKLKQVDFRFQERDFHGLEQNPKTKSRWATMARGGKKVMQFLEGGRYVAVVVDGKYIPYGKTKN